MGKRTSLAAGRDDYQPAVLILCLQGRWSLFQGALRWEVLSTCHGFPLEAFPVLSQPLGIWRPPFPPLPSPLQAVVSGRSQDLAPWPHLIGKIRFSEPVLSKCQETRVRFLECCAWGSHSHLVESEKTLCVPVPFIGVVKWGAPSCYKFLKSNPSSWLFRCQYIYLSS